MMQWKDTLRTPWTEPHVSCWSGTRAAVQCCSCSHCCGCATSLHNTLIPEKPCNLSSTLSAGATHPPMGSAMLHVMLGNCSCAAATSAGMSSCMCRPLLRK